MDGGCVGEVMGAVQLRQTCRQVGCDVGATWYLSLAQGRSWLPMDVCCIAAGAMFVFVQYYAGYRGVHAGKPQVVVRDDSGTCGSVL